MEVTEVTRTNFQERARAAAAAAAAVAARSPTARRQVLQGRPQRWREQALVFCLTVEALREILARELRDAGCATRELGRFFCVAGGGPLTPRSATSVLHLFSLIMDQDLEEFQAALATGNLGAYFKALLQPELLQKTLDAAKIRKVRRFSLRCSGDRKLAEGGKVLVEGLREGLTSTAWRFDERRPDVVVVAHLGADFLAIGVETLRQPREVALRGSMALLASAAAEGGALADPCCGQGALLQLTQELARQAPSRAVGRDVRQVSAANGLEISRGDGGQLPLAAREADAVVSDLPNSGDEEELAELYQRVVAEAARVLRAGGRLVLCGHPERLAQAVAQGPWKTVDTWPLTRWGRRGLERKAEAALEQLVCLERVGGAPAEAKKEEESAPRRSEEVKALWQRLGL